MATAFERLPAIEQERLIRLKKYLKLLRWSEAMTQKEFERVTYVNIRNAENGNGAFTPKSKHLIERRLPSFVRYFDNEDLTEAYHTRYEIPIYIIEVLIRNPQKYTDEQVKKCDYWVRLLTPSIYKESLPIEDILNVWHECFVKRYNCWLPCNNETEGSLWTVNA